MNLQDIGKLQEEHHGFWRNPHVKAEFSAAVYLAIAAGALYIGLHIAPLVCAVIAVGIIASDVYDWLHPRS